MTICRELLAVDPRIALSFALMYSQMVQEYIVRGDSENAALLASRAFHHANIVVDSRS